MDLALDAGFTGRPRFLGVGAEFHHLAGAAPSFAVVGKELVREWTEHGINAWFNDEQYAAGL